MMAATPGDDLAREMSTGPPENNSRMTGRPKPGVMIEHNDWSTQTWCNDRTPFILIVSGFRHEIVVQEKLIYPNMLGAMFLIRILILEVIWGTQPRFR